MKIVYTRPEDGGVSVVIASPKENIEKILGPLTQEQYEQHVMERSIPADALNVRFISDEDIPANREFRNAWVDVTPETQIDIDLERVKEMKLAELRAVRNAELEKLDKQFILALERGGDVEEIKAKKQALRDATEPLKQLEVSGVNDEEVLNTILELGKLE